MAQLEECLPAGEATRLVSEASAGKHETLYSASQADPPSEIRATELQEFQPELGEATLSDLSDASVWVRTTFESPTRTEASLTLSRTFLDNDERLCLDLDGENQTWVEGSFARSRRAIGGAVRAVEERERSEQEAAKKRAEAAGRSWPICSPSAPGNG